MTPHVAEAEHPLVAAYQRMIRAFNENDLGQVEALIDEHVVYVIPGKSAVAGRATSRSEHLAQLKYARERSGNTLRLEPKEIVAGGEYLFVYGRITAERAGKRLDSDHLVVFRFREGRIIEGRTVPVDLYEFDAFWA